LTPITQAPKRRHVDVVVLQALVRAKGVVDQRGTDGALKD